MFSSHTDTLVAALLDATPLRHHILTVFTTHPMSTALDRCDDSSTVEHPEVIERLARTVMRQHDQAAVVLRSFTGHTSQAPGSDTTIPIKQVCGWLVHDGAFHPLDTAQLIETYYTDADSGEPVALDHGLEVVDAWPVELAAFHALAAAEPEH